MGRPRRILSRKVLWEFNRFQGTRFRADTILGWSENLSGDEHGGGAAELSLANLVHSFDWELPDGIVKEDIDTEVITGITMHTKNALCLVAKNCTSPHTS